MIFKGYQLGVDWKSWQFFFERELYEPETAVFRWALWIGPFWIVKFAPDCMFKEIIAFRSP